MRRVLVTGSSGFVGTALSRMAAANQLEYPVELATLPESVDLRRLAAVLEAVRRPAPDAVIHLAAVSFVPDSISHPEDTYAVNLHGTINLLSALQAVGFEGAFLYVSSGDVYGAAPEDSLPLDERCLPRPRNPYAASKIAAEAYCYQIGQRSPIRVLIARPFNHIGPGQSERFAVAGFAKQIAEIRQGRRAPLIEVGNVDVTRDFSDVRDVVRAYLRLLESGVSGEAYNVCSGVERNVGEVLRCMLELSGVRAEVKRVSDKLRPNEQTRHYGSNRKLCEDTGWAPEVPFERSLRDLLESWKSR